MSDLNDLGLLLESKVPLLVIESYEEPRVIEMISRVSKRRSLPLFTWSATEGLNRVGFGSKVSEAEETTEPEKVLRFIKDYINTAIFILCDFHPFMKDEPINIRLLREIAMAHSRTGHTIVLLSHELKPPPELRRYCARFELSMPTREQLVTLVREEANNWSRQNNGKPVRSDSANFGQLVDNLRGVSLADARQLARGAIFDDGVIDHSDLPDVSKAKFALMDMEGVLSFEYETSRFEEVGGLATLKKWLGERRQAFLKPERSKLDTPKGIMLLGIQGSGKSLAAKAVASQWGIPLLRLDFGTLYNKYFGETEKNLRDALKLADMMSPCALWLDEIEKGISGGSSDQGTSKRLLGTLLTWMSERQTQVFLVATSNDISELPPELVRKGRLDEIFFVDLPDEATRAEIFTIHLSKRLGKTEQYDVRQLAGMTDGFSGAEIEQVIVGAMYSSAANEEALSMDQLMDAITGTNPLSVVMAEKVGALRRWADGRTVSAG